MIFSLFKYVLYFIGIIDCPHKYSKWSRMPEYNGICTRTGRVFENLESNYQHRHCEKCGYEEKSLL